MAITINDIQEKVFSTQLTNGYDKGEVDDFLDELCEEFRALVQQNLNLKAQNASLQQELDAKAAEATALAAKTPDYNEEGYFRNLQSAMRDSLISAQRVADETKQNAQAEADRTLADARAQADSVIAGANAQAEEIAGEARKAAESAKAEYEALKSAAEEYRSSFRQMVEKHLEVLKANDILFK